MSFKNMNYMKNNFILEKKYTVTELPSRFSRLNITHRKVHIFSGAKKTV